MSDKKTNTVNRTKQMVLEFFKGDVEKTSLWFELSNPNLGNVSPNQMIAWDRWRTLFLWVEEAVSSNKIKEPKVSDEPNLEELIRQLQRPTECCLCPDSLKIIKALNNENARINSAITFANKVIEDYKKENAELKENSAMLLRDRNHFEDSLNKIGDQAKDLYAQNQNLTEALERVDNWAKAYPENIFKEPTKADWQEIAKILKAGGYTIDAVSASNMRHVIKGVGEIAQQALKGD